MQIKKDGAESEYKERSCELISSSRDRIQVQPSSKSLVLKLERKGALGSNLIKEHKGVRSNRKGLQPDREDGAEAALGAADLDRGTGCFSFLRNYSRQPTRSIT